MRLQPTRLACGLVLSLLLHSLPLRAESPASRWEQAGAAVAKMRQAFHQLANPVTRLFAHRALVRAEPAAALPLKEQPCGLTTVVFVRHGETDHNALKILQGQADVPLNAEGLAQVRCVAARLKGKKIDAIYSSPLGRAKETAQAIANACGLKEVVLEDRFKEMGLGTCTGLKVSQIAPELIKRWSKDPQFALPSGVPHSQLFDDPKADYSYYRGKRFEGESLSGVQQRCWSALCDLGAANQGKTVVVASHGGIIKLLLAKANNTPIAEYDKYTVDNASQTAFVIDEKGVIKSASTW